MTNLILATDSYKQSHYLQYPPEARIISAYAEARPNPFSDEVLFFGLQAFLIDYLEKPVTRGDVEEAEAICSAHGVPFNRAGWDAIIGDHGGYLPLAIKALPDSVVNGALKTDDVLRRAVNDLDLRKMLSNLEDPGALETQISPAVTQAVKDSLVGRLKDAVPGL